MGKQTLKPGFFLKWHIQKVKLESHETALVSSVLIHYKFSANCCFVLNSGGSSVTVGVRKIE